MVMCMHTVMQCALKLEKRKDRNTVKLEYKVCFIAFKNQTQSTTLMVDSLVASA